MKLAAIHHVAIIVSDYEKSKDFYVNKLGFAIVRENFRKERNDWKLDLRVGEVAELEQMGIGCEPIRLDSYTQKKMTFFFDPDGLPLELHE